MEGSKERQRGEKEVARRRKTGGVVDRTPRLLEFTSKHKSVCVCSRAYMLACVYSRSVFWLEPFCVCAYLLVLIKNGLKCPIQ